MSQIRIAKTPGVLGGKPHIEGHRISVQQIVEYHEQLGWSVEEISEAFGLTQDDIHAALSYYHGHAAEVDEAIRAARARGERLRASYGSLLDLLDIDLEAVTTPQEIAEQYPVTAAAVYQAVRRGQLPARKSGGTWLIRRRDAEARWGHKATGASHG